MKTLIPIAYTEDPKKPVKHGDPMEDEMRALYKKGLRYNGNTPAYIVVKNAAQKVGINPSLLFSSAFQEGFNKSIAKPDEVSEAYMKAFKGSNNPDFPVDGFYNYGLDTFGDKYNALKKYLPQDFDKRFILFDAVNEKNGKVKTAAFRSDEDALIAKGAFMKMNEDLMNEHAKSKGVKLDDNARNYFTLASYNSGEENAKKMLDKYISAKDKKTWLEQGDVNWQKVHKNISPRMKHMLLAQQLLNSEQQVPITGMISGLTVMQEGQ